MAQVTIIGFGNPLRGDDGLGWYAARRLAGRVRRAGGAERVFDEVPAGDLEVLALHQLGLEHAEIVARSGRVIFIDANCSSPPGEWSCERIGPRAAIPALMITHHLAPAVLLTLAECLYGTCPERAYLLTVGGDSFDYGPGLSRTTARALSELEQAVMQCLGPEDGPATSDVRLVPRTP